MNTSVLKGILQKTDDYFSDKLQKFGATPNGVDWNSIEAQELRFIQLAKIFGNDDTFSICDYGCGFGNFFDYLNKTQPIRNVQYFGIDVSEAMIKKAEELHGSNENAHFRCGHELNETYDYVIASGIFNILGAETRDLWKEYMLETIEAFHRHSCKGFAFNCLTKYSDADKMKDYLYYADPLFLFDYVKRNFAKNVALLHDYRLYDFTILVRK